MSNPTALPVDLSPVCLNYVGALRGLKPMAPTDSFVYARTGEYDPETLICLAASNPQGTFCGVVANILQQNNASKMAADRGIANVSFVSSLDKLPQNIHYLCGEYTNAPLAPADREALFATAETRLIAGGTFCYRYRAYNNADETLQFLIAEYAPELSIEQAQEFLDEIKKLGTTYFADHPIARAALDKALENKIPDSFFEACCAKDAIASGTLDTMAALLPRGFSFVGDACVGANYMELAAPPATHAILEKCKDHLLYEPIKDFALGRLIRNDVWVKRPVEQIFDNGALFGLFTFGITMPRERVPKIVPTLGGAIQLTTPLFLRLIDLMTMLPMGIGDFLGHPAGQGMAPDDVVAAIGVLVACGIAQPMRGRYEGRKKGDFTRPLWSTSFNAHLDTTDIAQATVQLASPITGGVVTLSARDALVLQAVGRVGLSACAGALQPELERIITKNPALAAQIMESTEATDEVVNNIIASVVTSNMPRWYAYGLWAA